MTYTKNNIKGLKLYHCFHLFIQKDGDERDVQLFDHSQGDNDILKEKHGLLWTMPIKMLVDRLNFQRESMTTGDIWQWVVTVGYLPIQI